MTARRVAAAVAVCLVAYLVVLLVASLTGGEVESIGPAADTYTIADGDAGTGDGQRPPTGHGIQPALLERLQASTVQVRGLDCRAAQFGTGFVVGSDLIATGAHVVAGITAPIVRVYGTDVPTRVVAFDPVSDLALLRPADDLGLPQTLALGPTEAGSVGAVLAHDDDGGPVALPVVVQRLIRATGEDIYGIPAGGRDALELSARIHSGHSGAPVVDGEGTVVGVLFSRLRGGGSVAYAVQSNELVALIEGLSAGTRPAGPCR